MGDGLRISYAVQAHPRRSEMATRLAGEMGGEVVLDPDPTGYPSAWRTYRACLESTPAWATHRVVVQDDAELCDRFADAVPLAVAGRPDSLVALFVPGPPTDHARAVMKACHYGIPWAMLGNDTWCPAVALAWPAAMLEPFLRWVDRQRYPVTVRADDEIIGRYLRAVRQRAWATVPSLVEHPDMVDSIAGKRSRRGQYTGRIAACFVRECGCDPLLVDWSNEEVVDYVH